jgi:hypothetical protein
MSSGRVVMPQAHIGRGDYRLILSNPQPWERNSWFTFDRRTFSIRQFYRRHMALSNQYYKQHRPGMSATIRHWRNEPYQRITFWNGKSKNIRNRGEKCMEVRKVGRKNRDYHGNYIVFNVCQDGDHQGWSLDREGVKFPRYPLRDGIRFQIKSAMKGGRALFYHEHIGGHQWRLRIRNNAPWNLKQWFVFDWRTRTIRAQGNRRLAISIQYGQRDWNRNGYNAVVRYYRNNDQYQRLRWFGSTRRTIRDQGKRCLDVHGGSNTNNRHVIWWKCHNGANQGWIIDRQGTKFPAYPIRDGTRFLVRTRLPSRRPIAWVGGYMRLVNNDPYNARQWWVWDTRTKTLRSNASRGYALDIRGGFGNGKYVYVTRYSKRPTQLIRWFNGSRRNIRSAENRCLDVHGGHDSHNRHIIYWNCHNGRNQAWWLDQTGALVRKHPYNDGVRFQIRSRMAGGRALYHHYQHIGGHQYRLRIRDHLAGDCRQWFIFDRRTQSIRA